MNFNLIAQKYDRFNLIASGGLCLYWKKKLLETLDGKNELLDLCAGTGSISFSFLKKNPGAHALLLDLSSKMLEIASEKGKKLSGRFEILLSSAESIALADHSFDAISCAYGIRNIKDIDNCFSEAFRLLKEGGIFSIVELTRPSHPLFAWLHHHYLQTVIPFIGKAITKEDEPFHYLAKSILSFHAPHIIRDKLMANGFQKVQTFSLSGGIATLFTAKKL